jgi:predicted aldo/keto reductase-like oxidoreductase
VERRLLGKTGLEVGVIGFGTGYLYRKSERAIIELVGEALDHGVNYYDNWIPHAIARRALGIAFRGRRDRVHIAGHLGVYMSGDQPDRTRDPRLAERYFNDMLAEMGMEYVDVLMLHNVDSDDDYDLVMNGGLLECALRLKEQGRSRFIGFSGHESRTLIKATESGNVDVVMSPVGIAWKAEGVAEACERRHVGLVAMKPFWGGELLQEPYSDLVTPVIAISYALAQPAVSTVVPGYSSVQDLHGCLKYLEAPAPERDFTSAVARFGSNTLGACVYCGHCLPCTSGIGIGDVMSVLRSIQRGSPYALDRYASLKVKASACVACGECLDRCPQKVNIIENMREAVRMFGAL